MPFRRHWILYVEDNEDDVQIVREILPAARYPVVWAPSAEAARERLATTRFDLVLLDHGLPDTNSLLFLEEIRAFDARLPVIVVSGRHDDALVVSAGRKGAVGFLVKDEAPGGLERAVEIALRNLPASDRTRHATSEDASPLYEALLEMMNEGCLLVDLDGIVTYANGAAGRMSGGAAPDLLGRRAESLFDDATRKRFLEFHGSVGRPGAEPSIQLEGRLVSWFRNPSRDATDSGSRSDSPEGGGRVGVGEGPAAERGAQRRRGGRGSAPSCPSHGTPAGAQDARLRATPAPGAVEEAWPAGRPVLLSARAVASELGEGERCLVVLSDISELVESRNALRSRLAELERFQRLFVDREGRILELKEKVREYERRLGIEPTGVSDQTRRELERRVAETGKVR